MPTKEELNRGFELGGWEVLPARGVLRNGEQEEHPEPLVFGVLLALALRDGDLVTRDELVNELWEGRPTSDEPINRCLSRLRTHLGDRDRPHKYVETLTRRGYRLLKPVQLLHPDEPEFEPESAGGLGLQSRKIAATLVALGLLWFLASVFIPPGPVRSIGVLPFKNFSANADDQYLVSGFKEEIVHTLRNIPDFAVKNSRVSYEDEELKEIAAILEVDSVLVGSMQRSGDTLKIFYDVADGRTGNSISSDSVTGQLEDIFKLQEQVAATVRNELFGPSPQVLVSRSRPASFAAYDRYMRGLYAFERRKRGGDRNLDDAIELFQDTIRLDPNFGPAYLLLATAYALLPDYANAPLEELNRLAIDTVKQGIEVDDSIRDAGDAVFGFVFHKQKNWKLAEEAYVRATAAKIVDSNAFNWYSRMLASVGRIDAALDQARTAQEMDPTSAIINSRLALAYTYLDDRPMAYEFFERSEKLGAGGTSHNFSYALLLMRDGKLDEAYERSQLAIESAGIEMVWVDPVFAAFTDPEARDAALDAIDVAVAENQINAQVEFMVRGLLGDLDGAMGVARRLKEPGEVFEIELLFLPEMLSLREHDDFPDLMSALGISQYWEDNRCIWIDAAVRCPDD